MTKSTLTIWDSCDEPPEHLGLVYTWNGYRETGSVHSLFQYVESNDKRLRRKYLAWIHDLGESRIHGKRLIDHLALEGGLSYWWMTLLVEKSSYKSPIADGIRLLALEEILIKLRPSKICLVSSNQTLNQVLCFLCQKLGLEYGRVRVADSTYRRLSLRDYYLGLPNVCQALVCLIRQIYIRCHFGWAGKLNWFSGNSSLFFCSYFDNVDPKAADLGKYGSYYWGGLPALLRLKGYQSNWLQFFIPCSLVPTPLRALNWVKRFNRRPSQEGFHAFLEASLSWRVILRVLVGWVKLVIISHRLNDIQHAFIPPGSQLSLWPLMRPDWHASMRGSTAIINLMWIENFDKLLRDLPHQKRGFYLCENLAWERAFIHAWHKHGHGKLIAVAHSTVRYWDLRYFTDLRSVVSMDPYPMPQADLIALNGQEAVDAYLSVNYPKEGLIKCEALRYPHLKDLWDQRSPRGLRGEVVKVLILGDYVHLSNVKMLKMLETAASNKSSLTRYTVKPHPNTMINTGDYPSLDLNIVITPFGEMLNDYDIVYSSNSTSAAVDAYLSGLPVVVMLDDSELNLSPLRGRSGVCFVSSPEELAAALQAQNNNVYNRSDLNNFFFLDPELPRWSQLLID